MYKLEKSPICKVQQIGDLHFLKLHKNQIRQYLMGTVSVLKTDIKGGGLPHFTREKGGELRQAFPYVYNKV